QYENSRNNLTAYGEWADGLYKRVPGASAPLEMDAPIGAAPHDEAADKAFREGVGNAITEHNIDLHGAQSEGEKLFAGAAGQAALLLLEERMPLALSPHAES